LDGLFFFLASDDARMITGAILPAHGGPFSILVKMQKARGVTNNSINDNQSQDGGGILTLGGPLTFQHNKSANANCSEEDPWPHHHNRRENEFVR
jgi:hypothetical protein